MRSHSVAYEGSTRTKSFTSQMHKAIGAGGSYRHSYISSPSVSFQPPRVRQSPPRTLEAGLRSLVIKSHYAGGWPFANQATQTSSVPDLTSPRQSKPSKGEILPVTPASAATPATPEHFAAVAEVQRVIDGSALFKQIENVSEETFACLQTVEGWQKLRCFVSLASSPNH